ncbi:MAG TPA: hypothetical protein VGN42_19850 [Pirellulales bacterium]|jgi:hypothetical protein|nr:hypothetical protein [Pirellulales bacterium]
MATSQTNAFDEIWEIVRNWSPPQKRSLATRLLKSLEHAEPARPRKSLADLVGLAATDRSPPTDEEVEQILEEERMRKYG